MIFKLIEYVVKRLVEEPDAVLIIERGFPETSSVDSPEISSDRASKRVLCIQVAPRDLSRVIGREGRVFRALKGLVLTNSDQYRDVVVDSIAQVEKNVQK